MSLEKIYQSHEIEKKWAQSWEKSGYFQPQAGSVPYCIMLPPPNVTGTLHMGHAFQHTIMDLLIRYQRMKGKQTLWQGGTDHAGIATQMVVERQLQAQGINKHDIGRDAFVEKVWEWKDQSGNTISNQMRRLGNSIDWTRERFTMDEGLCKAVNEVFVRLYEEKLIYRGQRLVNWDPILRTAVSDLEVVSEEEEGFLWHIRYPLLNSTESLIVATTRPETLLGDTAVAVHPEDPRYQLFIGQNIQLPLTTRSIPIIADSYVDPNFGTGCLKITPAHDFNDYEMGKRHQLPMINLFTIDATLNDNAPLAYRGLDRFEARKVILSHLEKAGLLVKTEAHRLKVPRGDRSGAVIEPYLTLQWYVDAKTLSQEAITVVKEKKIQFVPENWENHYFDWMNNIQDWCISRQLWWGHRIPAWYDENNQVYVGRDESEVREKYQLSDHVQLTQDNDVLDTWFSSALWPFSTLGWPEKTQELKTYYPTNVLVTGFDIIFFWVARMIMLGLKFIGDVPFQHVYITGLILDAQGQKMSKSKGNILDPLDLIDGISLDDLVQKRIMGLMQPQMAKQIEKNTRKEYPKGISGFGTDALRFSLCAFATTNRFIRFDLPRVEGYRNFCNKIWNASRFVLMHTDGHLKGHPSELEFSLYDRAMQSIWQKTKKKLSEHIASYRFDLFAHTLYDFIWDSYCDWYLELSKPVLMQEASEKQRQGTRWMLVSILEEVLRATHPVMPYITEEIWQKLKPDLSTPTIMLQAYPEYTDERCDEKAEQALGFIQSLIMGLRNLRGEMNLSPNKLLKALYKTDNPAILEAFCENSPSIAQLAKLSEFRCLAPLETPPVCAHIISSGFEIFIPLADTIEDIQGEMERIAKELKKHQSDVEHANNKLNNENFCQRASPEAVEKERLRKNEGLQAIEKLSKSLESLRALP